MWHDWKHQKIRCVCGARIAQSQLKRHRQAKRHQLAARINQLLDCGLDYAEIGRQLRLTRAWVGKIVRENAHAAAKG